jgi:hypothetical protein
MASAEMVFKVRFVEQGVAGVSRTTDFPNTFPSKEVAEYVCQQIVEKHMGGTVPAGDYFEIYSVSPDGVEQSYGKWLGKRFAKIGVAAAVGTALGFLLGG